jgi:hypothetical protein
MELIDRYLAAVRHSLPAAKANDIVAELKDELLARQEEREERLGRPLRKDEVSAMLKDFGHPLVTAARYHSHQYLIGPDVFPFYLATMRIVVLIILAVVVAVGVGNVLFGGQEPIRALSQTISSLWMTMLGNVAIVTIVFAVLERKGFPKDHIMKWIPEQLPDLGDKQQGPWGAAIEIAMGIAFLLWWTGAIHLPFATNGGHDFRLEPDAGLAIYYWPVLVLAAAQLVHNLVKALRPRWKTLRALIGGATAVGGIALAAMLYQAGHWATVTSTGMPLQQAAELETSVNLALKIAIVVVGVIWTLGLIGGAWKFFRRS